MNSTSPSVNVTTLPVLGERGLSQILLDKNLAKLGDAYVNFAHSFALSLKNRKGVNARVPSNVLAKSLKKAGLKSLLPSRTSIHDQADAAEALSVHAWLTGTMTFSEYVEILSSLSSPEEAFANALNEIVTRMRTRLGKSCKIPEY